MKRNYSLIKMGYSMIDYRDERHQRYMRLAGLLAKTNFDHDDAMESLGDCFLLPGAFDRKYPRNAFRKLLLQYMQFLQYNAYDDLFTLLNSHAEFFVRNDAQIWYDYAGGRVVVGNYTSSAISIPVKSTPHWYKKPRLDYDGIPVSSWNLTGVFDIHKGRPKRPAVITKSKRVFVPYEHSTDTVRVYGRKVHNGDPTWTRFEDIVPLTSDAKKVMLRYTTGERKHFPENKRYRSMLRMLDYASQKEKQTSKHWTTVSRKGQLSRPLEVQAENLEHLTAVGKILGDLDSMPLSKVMGDVTVGGLVRAVLGIIRDLEAAKQSWLGLVTAIALRIHSFVQSAAFEAIANLSWHLVHLFSFVKELRTYFDHYITENVSVLYGKMEELWNKALGNADDPEPVMHDVEGEGDVNPYVSITLWSAIKATIASMFGKEMDYPALRQINALGSLTRTGTSLMTFMTKGAEAIKAIWEWVSEAYFLPDEERNLRARTHIFIEQVTEALRVPQSDRKLKWARKVHTLRGRGWELYAQLSKNTKYGWRYAQIVRGLAEKVRGLLAEADRKFSDLTSQFEALGICFQGAPGIGKTVVANFLADMAVGYITDGTEDELDLSLKYTKNGKSEYWDGATPGTAVVMWDEVFQTTDNMIRAEEATSLIQLVNSGAFYPNNAAVEKKDGNPLSPHLVLVTSNLDLRNWTASQLGIGDVGALKRRLHQVTLKAEPSFSMRSYMRSHGHITLEILQENLRFDVSVYSGVTKSYETKVENLDFLDLFGWVRYSIDQQLKGVYGLGKVQRHNYLKLKQQMGPRHFYKNPASVLWESDAESEDSKEKEDEPVHQPSNPAKRRRYKFKSPRGKWYKTDVVSENLDLPSASSSGEESSDDQLSLISSSDESYEGLSGFFDVEGEADEEDDVDNEEIARRVREGNKKRSYESMDDEFIWRHLWPGIVTMWESDSGEMAGHFLGVCASASLAIFTFLLALFGLNPLVCYLLSVVFSGVCGLWTLFIRGAGARAVKAYIDHISAWASFAIIGGMAGGIIANRIYHNVIVATEVDGETAAESFRAENKRLRRKLNSYERILKAKADGDAMLELAFEELAGIDGESVRAKKTPAPSRVTVTGESVRARKTPAPNRTIVNGEGRFDDAQARSLGKVSALTQLKIAISNDELTSRARISPIREDWWVGNVHMLNAPEVSLEIEAKGARRILHSTDIVEKVTVPNTDIVFLRLRHNWSKDMTNLFIKNEDLVKNFASVYVSWLSDLDGDGGTISNFQITDVTYDTDPINLNTRLSTVQVWSYFCGRGTRMPGVCGSYWISNDTKDQRKILGIHAGNRDDVATYCCPVTQELINKYCPRSVRAESADLFIDGLIDDFSSEDPEYLERVFAPEMVAKIPPGVRVVGIMRKDLARTMYARNDLYPSRLAEYGTPKGRPAAVRGMWRDGVYHHATERSEKKMARTFFSQDWTKWKKFLPLILENWSRLPESKYDPSDHAALNGQTILHDGEVYEMTPMFLNTSPGHGYVHLRTKDGKRNFVLRAELEDGTLGPIEMLPHYEERVELERAIMDANVHQRWISHANLKAEILPEAKALEGKVRIFYASALNAVHHTKQAFGRWMMMVRTQKPSGPNMVGFNPFSNHSHLLYRHMRRAGENVNWFDGDFAGYDLALPLWLWEAALWLVEEWYRLNPEKEYERWKRRRESLSRQFTSQFVVWLCFLIARFGGTLSGLFGTAEFNGLATEIMSLITFVELAHDHTEWSDAQIAEAWRRKIRLVVYGDDNLFAVNEDLTWFNRVTFAQKLKEVFGMDYTPAQKDALMTPYTPADEVSFLKRKFVSKDGGPLSRGTVLAVMDYDDIMERIYWVRKSSHYTEEEGVLMNVDSALREFALHGQPKFERMKTLINSWLYKAGYAQCFLSYKDACKNFFPDFTD
jgi:hypothetical protein